MNSVLRLMFTCVAALGLAAVPLPGQTTAASTPPNKPARPVARHRTAKPAPKAEEPPPQPTPVAPMTPEQLPAAAPRVSYRSGVLTVDSENSTLGAILNAIRRQIGAQIDTPPAGSGQRVAGHFSGSPRQVLSSLLDGSELGYAIIGAPDDPEHVQQVILMVQSRNGSPSSGPAASSQMPSQNQAPTAEEDPYADLGPEEGPTPEQMNQRFPGGRQNPNGGGDQPGDTGIPNRPPHMPPSQNTQDSSQQQIKTPEQLLQELQRQRNHTAQ